MHFENVDISAEIAYIWTNNLTILYNFDVKQSRSKVLKNILKIVRDFTAVSGEKSSTASAWLSSSSAVVCIS